MAFKTPIDYGFAQVIDNSGLVNAYAQQQLANQKAKQAREKEMADQLAKIKPDGIKEADIPEIENRYKNLQGLYHKASTSNSLKDKAEYDAGVRQMMYDIEKSKNSQALYADRLKFYGEHSDDKQLDPDYMTRISAIKDIPTFSNDYATVTNDLERIQTAAPTVDLKKDFDAILKDSEVTNKVEFPMGGGRFKTREVTEVDPMTVANKIVARGVSDKNYNKQLFTNYFDAFHDTDREKDIAEAKARGFKNYDPNSLSNYVALQVLRTAKPPQQKEGSKGDGNTKVSVNINNGDERVAAGTAVENQPIPFTNASDVVNGKKVEGLKENTVARKWLAVNGEVDVNTYGGINMDTGEKYTDKDVISGKVIGIGELPIFKKSGGFVKDRHVDQLDKAKNIDWKDKFIVAVKDKYGNTTRVAVPLSQYPLKDVWTKAYDELGVKGQVQGANIDASKGNTDRLKKVQTPLAKKSSKPSVKVTVLKKGDLDNIQ